MSDRADAEALAELRPHGFAIAYRMLGSVADADVVQEAMLRTQRELAEGERIDSLRAYLATVVTRLAIDQLRSARRRREQYVGEWLPEPLLTAAAPDPPAESAELADSLSLALLVVLESLTPQQRAAFLLRDVFAYSYEEIATIVDTSEANARQLAARARREVGRRRPRFEASREARERLAERFFAAALEGDLEGLERLLADEVVLHGDGGGKVPALARPVSGAGRVSRTLRAWVSAAERVGPVRLRRVEVNGQPGALILGRDDRPTGALVLQIASGHIAAIHSIVNPEKLAHLPKAPEVA